MLKNNNLDSRVINNFTTTSLWLFIPPILLLLSITFVFIQEDAFTIDGYVNIQKDLFFFLNSKLSGFANLQFNLTQLGDALILFPLVTVFIVYAPKLWGALLTSAIISCILSCLLKLLFAVPRPATMFDNDSFVIIGKTLSGPTALPSGHSITIFTIITLLLIGFMPKDFKYKMLWTPFVLILGVIIAFSRVGVGAHYPLDVIIGIAIGYISALIGIILNNRVGWWNWIQHKKYYPIFMLFLTIWMFVIIKKIFDYNLLIFYISLFSLITTILLMINIYVRKEY